MKKFIALIVSLVLLMGSVIGTVAEESHMGDIDGNGKIDIIDATAIQRHIARIIAIDETFLCFTDVDGDGEISVMDCTSVQRFIAKIIRTFPCESTSKKEVTEETTNISSNSSLKPAETQVPTAAQTQVATQEPTQPPTQAPKPTVVETQPPTENKEQICKDIEQEILRLVNVERKKANLKNLKFADDYYECAKLRAVECCTQETFSHTRPNGKPWHSVFKELKAPEYISAGENLALYFQTPKQVVDEWMGSKGHRANILNPDFTMLAVGVYETPDWPGYYSGVQLFIQPKKG